MHTRSIVALAAALSSPLVAADPQVEAPGITQPEVVVTATRSAETVDAALAPVSVITRADIERSAAPDLLELLRDQPGVDLVRSGGTGQATTLFLRGTNSTHVLVLIDGVRVASTNSGVFDFAHLPLDQIERIEIVRGPRAAYWGSDAIGGVIQIFTRAPGGESAHVYAGRYGRVGGSASAGVEGERGGIGITLGGERFRGFSAQNPAGFSYDPDDDGYLNRNVALRGHAQLGTQRLALTAIRTDADVDFDQGATSAKNQSAGVELSGPIADAWSHRLTVGTAREDLDTPAFYEVYASRRETLDWIHEVKLAGPLALAFGVNLEHARGTNRDTFTPETRYRATRNDRAAFAGLSGRIDTLDWQVAARYDHDSAFGGQTTPQLALGWQPSALVRVTGSYGEGFRAPNLNELYSPGFGGMFGGNPDLDAEHSRSAEAGVELTPSATQRLEVHAFRTRIDDLIAYSGGADFHAVNVDRARVNGGEVVYAGTFGPWLASANATVQSPIDEDTGQLLLRRPRRKASAEVGYRFDGGAEIGVEGFVSSARADFGATLPGYGLVNLRASWPLADGLALDLRLDNAFDRDYELAHGYDTPGRAWLVGLRWTDR